MKFSKMMLMLFLFSSLTFCSMFGKKATPGTDGDGTGDGGNDGGTSVLPGGDGSDATADLGELTEGDPNFVELTAYITDANGNNIISTEGDGGKISYTSPEDVYSKGFTVDINKAGRYYREAKQAIVPGNLNVRYYSSKTGKLLKDSTQSGYYEPWNDDIKKLMYCTDGSKKVLIYVTYDSKNAGGKKDSYIKAPPITFTGTYTC